MEKLTDQQIDQLYDQLGKLHVTLENVPEKGLSYIKERLALCRAMQDQAQNLRLTTGQALSYVQTQRIFVKHAIPLAQSDQEKEQLKIKLSEREQECVSHGMLHRLVNATASALSQTARDIKLLGDVMIKQIKLGEMTDVNPADSPAVGREATFEDMARGGSVSVPFVQTPEGPAEPSFEVTTTPPVEPAPVFRFDPFRAPAPVEPDMTSVFGTPNVVVPAQVVGVPTAAALPDSISFDAPPPQVEAERIQLADRSSVPIEALFAELSGTASSPAL